MRITFVLSHLYLQHHRQTTSFTDIASRPLDTSNSLTRAYPIFLPLSLSFTISPPRIFFLIRFGDCRVRNGGDDAIGCRKTACHLAPERMMVRAALPLCLGGANV